MIALPNRTRTSPSIPRRLLREGKLHLLPLYALMRTSDLAREGIENSGSYRFSDHVYRNEPGGRLIVGWMIDAALLRLRGARSMRSRFHHSCRQIVGAVVNGNGNGDPMRVASIPCGIARDLAESARSIDASAAQKARQVRFYGVDIDPGPLELSRRLTGSDDRFAFIEADALDNGALPADLDIIVSTGFGEFLDDDTLVRFYRNCFDALKPNGLFVTSGMMPDPIADYLMRELAELRAHYRGREQLVALLAAAGFAAAQATADADGLQTLIVVRRPASVTP